MTCNDEYVDKIFKDAKRFGIPGITWQVPGRNPVPVLLGLVPGPMM